MEGHRVPAPAGAGSEEEAPCAGPARLPLWNQDIEDEANWLGATLLIPGPAARAAARRRLSHEQVADKFGCSTEMARWRMNMTGARRMLTQRA
jgi:hypothetical protein